MSQALIIEKNQFSKNRMRIHKDANPIVAPLARMNAPLMTPQIDGGGSLWRLA